MFRVDPVEIPVRVVIQINDVAILDQTFDTSPQRTWHEVIGAGALKATGNELVVSVLAGRATATSAGLSSLTSSCSSKPPCPEPEDRRPGCDLGAQRDSSPEPPAGRSSPVAGAIESRATP